MSNQPPSFIYFGTPGVARATLGALLSAGMRPLAVVTNPDAPKGRGRVIIPAPTKAYAEGKSIPVLTPVALDGATIETIRAFGAELAVVVAYGKLFPQALIDAFPMGAINVHYSLLPKYRGATPMESALLAGESETGVTIQRLVLALDVGDILAQEVTPIGEHETARELRPRLIELGAQMLVKLLPRLDEATPRPQDDALATRAKKFKKEDGQIDPAAPTEENWRKYRAYAGTIGTYFFKDGVRFKITKASFDGKVLKIERVIPEGKSETDWHG